MGGVGLSSSTERGMGEDPGANGDRKGAQLKRKDVGKSPAEGNYGLEEKTKTAH